MSPAVAIAGGIVLLLALGVLLELRRRDRARIARLEADLRLAVEARDGLAARLAIEERARAALERRRLDPGAGLALLAEAAARIEKLSEEDLYPAVLALLADHLGADECSIFSVEAGRLRERARRGRSGALAPAADLEDRDPEEGLVGLALRERRVVSAREAPPGTERVAALAAPLISEDGTAIGALEVRAMPFFALTASAERVAALIAGWAARACDRARYLRLVREKAAQDEAVGIARHAYLVERLAEEIARARRHGEPLSLLLVEALDWDIVPEASRRPVRKALVGALRASLRASDPIFCYKDERSFAAVLPETGASGAERARERVREAIAALGLEPYARKGPLEVAVGAATLGPDAETPAALEAAAERDARPAGRSPAEASTERLPVEGETTS